MYSISNPYLSRKHTRTPIYLVYLSLLLLCLFTSLPRFRASPEARFWPAPAAGTTLARREFSVGAGSSEDDSSPSSAAWTGAGATAGTPLAVVLLLLAVSWAAAAATQADSFVPAVAVVAAAAAAEDDGEDDGDVAEGPDELELGAEEDPGLQPRRDPTSGSKRSRMSDLAMGPMERG